MSFPIDQPVRLSFRTYSDAAQTTLADATTVTLYVRDPAGTETTYTLAGAQVVRESTGVYHYDLTPSLAGHYSAHWKATGAVATSTDEGFDVDPRYGPWVTLQDAKDHLNKSGLTTDDRELQNVIDAVTAAMAEDPQYRIGDAVALTTYTEWVDARGDTLSVQHYPITDIDSVTEYSGGTAQVIAAEPLDGGSFTGYGWDYADGTGANGMLVRFSGGSPIRWQGSRVKVVYTAGTASVPPNIREAALVAIKEYWRSQRGTGAGRAVPGSVDEVLDQLTPDAQSQIRFLLNGWRRMPAIA